MSKRYPRPHTVYALAPFDPETEATYVSNHIRLADAVQHIEGLLEATYIVVYLPNADAKPKVYGPFKPLSKKA